MGKKILTSWITLCLVLIAFRIPAEAAPSNPERERLLLYQGMEAITGIPWPYLAAVDQYERNLRRLNKDLPEEKGLIAIHIPPRRWSGPFNPDPEDKVPASIRFSGEWDGTPTGTERPIRRTIWTPFIPSPGISPDSAAPGTTSASVCGNITGIRWRWTSSPTWPASMRPSAPWTWRNTTFRSPALQLHLPQHLGRPQGLGRAAHPRGNRHLCGLRHAGPLHLLRVCGIDGLEPIRGMAGRNPGSPQQLSLLRSFERL